MKEQSSIQCLERRFREALLRRPPPARLGVGVSGGADSVALFFLLLSTQKEFGYSLMVIHIDHGIRPESRADALWVEHLAQTQQIPFRNVQLAPPPTHLASGLEAWAREERLRIFGELTKQHSLEAIALGHQAQDQSETILGRFMRGCSLAGLSGMRPRQILKSGEGRIRLWRPLLEFSRDDLEIYLRELGQEWRDDPTNRSPVFFRNRLRHELLPLMDSIRPQSSFHLREMGSTLREVQDWLAHRAKSILASQSSGLLSITSRRPEFLWREILRQWWIREVPHLASCFSRPLCKRLVDLIQGHSGRRLQFRQVTITRESDCLRLTRPIASDKGSLRPFPPQTPPIPLQPLETVTIGGESFFISREVIQPATSGIWVADELVQAGLFLRYPEPGDLLQPIGHSSVRKLARWFIRQKIPRSQRHNLIVTTISKSVIWVPGLVQSAATSIKQRPGDWFIGYRV